MTSVWYSFTINSIIRRRFPQALWKFVAWLQQQQHDNIADDDDDAANDDHDNDDDVRATGWIQRSEVFCVVGIASQLKLWFTGGVGDGVAGLDLA